MPGAEAAKARFSAACAINMRCAHTESPFQELYTPGMEAILSWAEQGLTSAIRAVQHKSVTAVHSQRASWASRAGKLVSRQHGLPFPMLCFNQCSHVWAQLRNAVSRFCKYECTA